MRVAIVEDELVERDYVQKLIHQWGDKNQCPVGVDCFASAEQFLMECEEFSIYQVMILDIQMGKMNGMELAHCVREHNQDVHIIFLTGITDYALEGYEVEAVRYLIKPIEEKIFFELMTNLKTKETKEDTRVFVFQYQGQMVRIKFATIEYIEARGHYLYLKAGNKEYEWKASLSSIEDELQRNYMILCRRGLYVNLLHIVQIGRNECYLENGESLPVSKSRYEQCNQAFIQLYKNGGLRIK